MKFHIFHDWSKWKEIDTYQLKDILANTVIERGKVLERKCSICDLVECKKVEVLAL